MFVGRHILSMQAFRRPAQLQLKLVHGHHLGFELCRAACSVLTALHLLDNISVVLCVVLLLNLQCHPKLWQQLLLACLQHSHATHACCTGQGTGHATILAWNSNLMPWQQSRLGTESPPSAAACTAQTAGELKMHVGFLSLHQQQVWPQIPCFKARATQISDCNSTSRRTAAVHPHQVPQCTEHPSTPVLARVAVARPALHHVHAVRVAAARRRVLVAEVHERAVQQHQRPAGHLQRRELVQVIRWEVLVEGHLVVRPALSATQEGYTTKACAKKAVQRISEWRSSLSCLLLRDTP